MWVQLVNEPPLALGFIQKLCWQVFGFFWLPNPLRLHFLPYKNWHFLTNYPPLLVNGYKRATAFFWPKKVHFKAKIYIFLTLMVYIYGPILEAGAKCFKYFWLYFGRYDEIKIFLCCQKAQARNNRNFIAWLRLLS